MSSYTPEPYDDDRFRVTPRRPPSVTVLAVLHLIGDGIGLVLTLCAGVSQLAGGNLSALTAGPNPPPQVRAQQAFQKRLEAHIASELPWQQAYTGVGLGIDLLLDVLLLAAGVGLLSLRPWARTLSLGYAWLSLATKVVGIIVFCFTWPAMSAFLRQEAAADPALAQMANVIPIAVFAGLLFSLVLAVYPLAVLIILTRPSVVAAFRGKSAPPEGDGGRDREEWNEPPPDAFTR